MPRKTKIGTEVAYVTRDSDTTFKVKKSKVKVIRPLYSPPCWRVRQLQGWAWKRIGREKLLLRCRLLGRARRFGAHGERRGAGAYRGGRLPTACYYYYRYYWPKILNFPNQPIFKALSRGFPRIFAVTRGLKN